MIRNSDDEEIRQTIRNLDRLLEQYEVKGDKDMADEIRSLKRAFTEELEAPSTLLRGLDGVIRQAKIKIKDKCVEIKQEGKEKIYGRYAYSPNKKYIAVIVGDYYLVMPDGIHEKFIRGKVYLIEDQEKICWGKTFYSPEEVFITDSGQVAVIDSLRCYEEPLSCLFLVSVEGEVKLEYVFESNPASVSLSSNQNRLTYSTPPPDESAYLFDLVDSKLIQKTKKGKDVTLSLDDKYPTLSQFKPRLEGLTEEYEHSQFEAKYSKPEFKEFKYDLETGYVPPIELDYLDAMGITELTQFFDTDISILVRRASGKFFHPGPTKIYNFNEFMLEKYGQELKGIDEYIPVSESVSKGLTKIGINKLSDFSNYSADDVLSVKGVGEKTLTLIDSALQKYHLKSIKKES